MPHSVKLAVPHRINVGSNGATMIRRQDQIVPRPCGICDSNSTTMLTAVWMRWNTKCSAWNRIVPVEKFVRSFDFCCSPSPFQLFSHSLGKMSQGKLKVKAKVPKGVQKKTVLKREWCFAQYERAIDTYIDRMEIIGAGMANFMGECHKIFPRVGWDLRTRQISFFFFKFKVFINCERWVCEWMFALQEMIAACRGKLSRSQWSRRSNRTSRRIFGRRLNPKCVPEFLMATESHCQERIHRRRRNNKHYCWSMWNCLLSSFI